MFFITCFETLEPDDRFVCRTGDLRCFGFYGKYENAVEDLHGNNCDMHEYLYNYAVIEEMEEGIHPNVKSEQWFQWDLEKKGFFEIEKPKCTMRVCNWALG